MSKPFVSVIIDTYNYGTFIEKSIESALAQDFPASDMEVIVIDDGSTDDTAERVRKYAGRVQYICQKNTGQAGVFNTAFNVSKGEIISFLDADDFWYPQKLKTIAEAFRKYPDAGLVQHPSEYVDIKGGKLDRQLPVLPEFYTLEYFLKNPVSFYGTSNLSFRREYLKNLMPEPLDMGNYADQYLYWNILFYAKVHNINTPLAAHRIHNTNWYANMFKNLKMLEMHIHVLEKANSIFMENLKSRGIAAEAAIPAITEQETGIIKEKIILHRKRREILKALNAYRALFRYPLTKYNIFKATTLLCAVISPGLYFTLFNMYADSKTRRAS